MSETTFSNKEAWLLGHEALPNFEKAGLSAEVIDFHRQQKAQIIPALKRGFVLPCAIPLPAVPVEMPGYPIEETDCFAWFDHMQQFAEKFFGATFALRDKLPLPARLPWKNVLPIFDPGLTNREMVDKALKARKLLVYEGTDVMRFTGSGAFDAPCLYFIERSITPTPATMGLPPKFARHWFSGRQTVPLHLRAYGIGTSLLHEVEEQFLDPETWTWFPENTLPGGRVAFGGSGPASGKVEFLCLGAGNELVNAGFREAIVLSLTP